MQRFRRILFVSHGFPHESEAIKQALKLTIDNQAQLKILIICPSLPETLEPYKDSYQHTLIDNVQKMIAMSENQLGMNVPVQGIEVEFESTPHLIRIISQIIRDKNDLLMKAVESDKINHGFKALDMELVRKCPCPVWLYRARNSKTSQARIGVAIDPLGEEDLGKELAIRLLKVADQLATKSGSTLSIITCWDYPLENTLRNSPFINIPEDHIQNIVHEHELDGRKALDHIIKKAKLSSELNLFIKRGIADEVIPALIIEQQIDLLVMGTVGRTGISGFVIGNTAVNVLQKISCSLLALKPKGFVSPVKA